MGVSTNKKPNSNDMQTMAEILKAASHQDRLVILRLLCKTKGKRLTVKAIYEKLGLQQPIVSRHLNILKRAGIVRRLQEGPKIYYCLCMEKVSIESLSKCFC